MGGGTLDYQGTLVRIQPVRDSPFIVPFSAYLSLIGYLSIEKPERSVCIPLSRISIKYLLINKFCPVAIHEL